MASPIRPARLDWPARRGGPFKRSIRIRGVNLNGATARAQVRAYPDAATPIFDLPWRAGGTISDALDGGTTIWTDLTGAIPISFIGFWIKQSLIDAYQPFALNNAEPGQSLLRAWDVYVTPAGGVPACWYAGDFLIEPGVTK